MSSSTLSSPSDTAHSALRERLDALVRQRAQVEADCALANHGDSIDRTIDAGAHIHLAELDRRIEDLTLKLQRSPSAAVAADDLHAHVGSIVTLRFDGDEPETFVLDQLDQTLPGTAVITPESPLGRVVMGSRAGALLTCRMSAKRSLSVAVLDVASA